MFDCKDKTPYSIFTSKQTFDLLLLSNSKNSHYVLSKDFDRCQKIHS